VAVISGGHRCGPVDECAVISKEAHENVGGKPFASSVEYSHSSFLRTMQEIFQVDPHAGFPWLGGAAIANDVSALFKPGAIE
jgi:hypothetical protein